MPAPLRLLVCGARDFDDAARLNAVLDAVHAERGIAVLIEGEAPGADRLARDWAQARGLPVAAYAPDPGVPERAASRLRNSRMLEEGKPDHVIAFPSGRLDASPGTLDMVTKARGTGVPTVVIDPQG